MTAAANDDEFRDAAIRSGLLARETAHDLHRSAVASGISFVEFSLKSGALTSPQLEIVETFRRPGEIAPGYEVMSLLGEGGMGVVYRARQIAFDREVALKTVRAANANPSALARFEQEARTIGRLIHPHIVTAYDFGRHAGRFYLALELIEGLDAEQYVERHTALSETLVWQLVRQAASGLAYAAEQGVIHRDIKPANLLIVVPPRGYPLPPGVPLVKIADFGLALLQDSIDERTRLTMEHTTVGSPLYMAPEQLAGSRVDLRADIYALGATAYHLLSGYAPFAGLPLAQTYAQKLQGQPTPLTALRPELSPATLELVDWLMQRDPQQRPPDYAAVIAAIDAHWSPAGLATPPLLQETLPSLPKATLRPATGEAVDKASRISRRTWLVVAGGAGGVLLTAAAIDRLRSRPAPPAPPDWLPTGWGVDCFNGRDLTGWQTRAGHWIPGLDDGEGGRVLAGSGMLVYPFPKPLVGYRLLLLASLQSANAIELQFGFAAAENASAVLRHVLRMTAERVQLGTRSSDLGALAKLVVDREMPLTPTAFIEWQLVRQEQVWRVAVDGEWLATIPDAAPSQSVFVLSAERPPGQSDTQAWFSDIQLEELAPRTP